MTFLITKNLIILLAYKRMTHGGFGELYKQQLISFTPYILFFEHLYINFTITLHSYVDKTHFLIIFLSEKIPIKVLLNYFNKN